MPAALGNLAEAIEEELARVRRFPGPPAQRLTNLASSCDDWWPLACRPELQARVRALFHDARLPVPTAVQALWIPRRESPPGRALFPLALRGARGEAAAGSLRDLRVGLVSPDGQQHRPTDRGFLRAIDNARSLACTLAGRADRASAEPDWWLCPNVESNTDLDGGSVALAAFVAFSSWALRVPVPRSHVFTGVLGADAFSAPSGLTLDQKLEAADRSGMAETLFCPGLTDAQWQRLAQGRRHLQWMCPEALPYSILEQIFPRHYPPPGHDSQPPPDDPVTRESAETHQREWARRLGLRIQQSLELRGLRTLRFHLIPPGIAPDGTRNERAFYLTDTLDTSKHGLWRKLMEGRAEEVTACVVGDSLARLRELPRCDMIDVLTAQQWRFALLLGGSNPPGLQGVPPDSPFGPRDLCADFASHLCRCPAEAVGWCLCGIQDPGQAVHSEPLAGTAVELHNARFSLTLPAKPPSTAREERERCR